MATENIALRNRGQPHDSAVEPPFIPTGHGLDICQADQKLPSDKSLQKMTPPFPITSISFCFDCRFAWCYTEQSVFTASFLALVISYLCFPEVCCLPFYPFYWRLNKKCLFVGCWMIKRFYLMLFVHSSLQSLICTLRPVCWWWTLVQCQL